MYIVHKLKKEKSTYLILGLPKVRLIVTKDSKINNYYKFFKYYC